MHVTLRTNLYQINTEGQGGERKRRRRRRRRRRNGEKNEVKEVDNDDYCDDNDFYDNANDDDDDDDDDNNDSLQPLPVLVPFTNIWGPRIKKKLKTTRNTIIIFQSTNCMLISSQIYIIIKLIL